MYDFLKLSRLIDILMDLKTIHSSIFYCFSPDRFVGNSKQYYINYLCNTSGPVGYLIAVFSDFTLSWPAGWAGCLIVTNLIEKEYMEVTPTQAK